MLPGGKKCEKKEVETYTNSKGVNRVRYNAGEEVRKGVRMW